MTIDWQLVIDCASPEQLVPFWAAALGYVPPDPPDGHASWREYYLSLGVPESELDCEDCLDRLVDPAGVRPPIWFQVVPEGKSVKNRLHLDLKVGGGRSVRVGERRPRVDATVATLVNAGGSVVRSTSDGDTYYVVMADPEGNEFCVV